MFSGIIEAKGNITNIVTDQGNTHLEVKSPWTSELYIDQSIAHNGVCLTVVNIKEQSYIVTAIEETLKLTNLGDLKKGSPINLERCMLPTTRMDGHMVQGHVDTTAVCSDIKTLDGSWYFTFSVSEAHKNLLVSKGSVSVNGVSLTVVEPTPNSFQVAIIPYTYEHTTFSDLAIGDRVNIEFDIIGKYVARYMEATRNN